MKCSEVREKLSPYLDKELDQGQTKRIEDHLNQCPVCLKEWGLIRKTDDCLKSIPCEEPSREFHRKLFQELDAFAIPVNKRGSIRSLYRMIDRIFILFQHRKGSWPMDAFDDFPPWSLGHAYLNLIKQNQ